MGRNLQKYWLIISLILVCVVGFFVYITGALDYIPRLRASAQSPDGALTVRVYQKRLALRPFFPRMGAIAKVFDQNEKLVYEKTIFSDDDWGNTLGDAYTQIVFVGEEIRISPKPYDRAVPFTIKKADLWTLPN